MMQTNPKEVMEKYKDNPEFTKLMVEFSKVMGGHFNKIGEQEKAKQQPATDPEVDVIVLWSCLCDSVL